jgi:hypothetical protein
MVDEVIEFTRNYAVWRELMEAQHSHIRSAYPDLLLTVTNSMVLAFCVGTYQLFDKNPQTKSLCRLIDDIRPSHGTLAQRLESDITAQKQTLNIVFHIRNNVYGHRNKSRDPRDIFANAKLTPRMMKAVVHLAQDVVSSLAVAAGAGDVDELRKEFRRNEAVVLADTRDALSALQD